MTRCTAVAARSCRVAILRRQRRCNVAAATSASTDNTSESRRLSSAFVGLAAVPRPTPPTPATAPVTSVEAALAATPISAPAPVPVATTWGLTRRIATREAQEVSVAPERPSSSLPKEDRHDLKGLPRLAWGFGALATPRETSLAPTPAVEEGSGARPRMVRPG
eukprot:scaffold308477_cov26-Tisochrysis_lutea.AAC.2